MLSINQLTSVEKPTVSGKVDKLLGAKILSVLYLSGIPENDVSMGNKSKVVEKLPEIVYGAKRDITVEINPRPDKRNWIQVYVSADVGAIRLYDKYVCAVTTILKDGAWY